MRLWGLTDVAVGTRGSGGLQWGVRGGRGGGGGEGWCGALCVRGLVGGVVD